MSLPDRRFGDNFVERVINSQSDFIIGEDLDKIHDQAALALSQLSPGATLTLAFNQPLTVSAEALYQQKFADLIANLNFIRINGF